MLLAPVPQGFLPRIRVRVPGLCDLGMVANVAVVCQIGLCLECGIVFVSSAY
jgi:hypothetical protein